MRIVKLSLVTFFCILLLINCSKENNSLQLHSNGITGNATAVNTNIPIPLNDLGINTFNDSVGGLYPNGQNTPSGTYAANLLKACKNIVPIDTFGNTSNKGKVVFISIGGSTGGHNMKDLISKTNGNPLTNPNLKLFTCNNGTTDASLKDISDTNSSYWLHVTGVIIASKSSNRQVQVIYLETDDTSKIVNFPIRPTMVKNDLEECLRIFRIKFPNLKIVYVLGRTRTFGSKALWNKEPCPYYFGWACKWAIQDQINGVRGTQYIGKNAVAPMITWGFYQWADSLPRKTDGFYWRSTETADGLHANAAGEDTLSTHFQNFLLSDPTASIWYAAH
jgi:hypothetical protein